MDTPKIYVDFYSTLESGQTFSWYLGKSGCYYSVVECKQVRVCPGKVPDWDEAYWVFRLGDDLDEIYASIDKDAFMHNAISSLKGMRLIKSDPWETIVSFMTSTHNTVREIKASLLKLRQSLGSSVQGDWGDLGFELKAFPTPSQLASADVNLLTSLGFGFRSKYILDFAKSVAQGDFDLNFAMSSGYERGKEYLMSVKGIGPKVADCVMLFAGGYLQAFPVDVWIRKVVGKVYLHRDSDEKTVASFGVNYFGKYAGYAQEYMYAYSRGIRARPSAPPRGLPARPWG
ncbi:hypothetical protein PQ610_05840 [Tardisphaera miroshnichenkoae]